MVETIAGKRCPKGCIFTMWKHRDSAPPVDWFGSARLPSGRQLFSNKLILHWLTLTRTAAGRRTPGPVILQKFQAIPLRAPGGKSGPMKALFVIAILFSPFFALLSQTQHPHLRGNWPERCTK